MIQAQSQSTFRLVVEGKLTIGLPDRSPQVLDRAEIARLPHMTVTVKQAGRKSTYSGVLVRDLLEHAGVNLSTERQRANLGRVVMIAAAEDSSVLFAAAELDSSLVDRHILLADSKGGKLLTAPEGPFRIIVPDEKEPLRWVRQVWAIYVAQVSDSAGER